MSARAHLCRIVLGVTVILGMLSSASPARANIPHYEVRVDGLACPFCAYGLEKKLEGLPGVSGLHIDLDAGLVSFDVTEATVLLPGRVREVVREAGFSPRGVTVQATGTVRGESDDLRLDVGDGHTLGLSGGQALEELRVLIRDFGVRDVVVWGPMTQSGDAWQLRVERVAQQEEP